MPEYEATIIIRFTADSFSEADTDEKVADYAIDLPNVIWVRGQSIEQVSE